MLLKTARSPAELAEYRDLQQSYTSFADNLDWLAANAGKTVTGGANGAPAAERRKRQAEHIDEEKILRCLGAAVILHWNTIPTQLQRALFEAASSIRAGEPRRRRTRSPSSCTITRTTRSASRKTRERLSAMLRAGRPNEHCQQRNIACRTNSRSDRKSISCIA